MYFRPNSSFKVANIGSMVEFAAEPLKNLRIAKFDSIQNIV